MPDSKETLLRILHFNDVYHVAPGSSEPVGGAARFGSLLHKLQLEENAAPTLTLFSGDAYFPSLESSISRGEHMLPILNKLNVDASTFGNHEFDQGIDQLESLIKRNNFPWVITNLTDKETGGPAARYNSASYLIREIGSLRVGIIGIVEKEWLDTLPCLPLTFKYHDFVDSAKDMATKLKNKGDKDMSCDLVICLSHMRLPNDIKLADECADVVDLILSGHDHFYYLGSGISEFSDPNLASLPNKYSGHDDDEMTIKSWEKEKAELSAGSIGRRLIKSGTDFRDLSEIVLQLGGNSDKQRISRISVTRHRVTSNLPENEEIKEMVDAIEAHLSKAMDKVIGFTNTPWDARSTVCRTQESNIGSFSGDLMRLCYAGSVGVEIGLLCGGAIRSDKVYEKGQVKMRDIMEIFPFEDPVVVVKLTGDQIRRALENGISKWPAQEGRFPQVSGIRFEFDPKREPGNRVTSIVLTASAKAAAKHAKSQSPDISRESSTQFNSRKRAKSVSSVMHKVAVHKSIAASGQHSTQAPTIPNDESLSETESDIDTESDYGGEEDELLDMDTEYLVATRNYMYQGHDGYDVLNEGKLIVDEENGITFADLYRRFFRGLAVCNALSFKKHGYAQNCSSIRHELLKTDSDDIATTVSIVAGLNVDKIQAASKSTEAAIDEPKQPRWKQLIVKHADDLKVLAQQQKRESIPKDKTAIFEEESSQTLASRIASIVEQYHDGLVNKAQLLTHRRSHVLRALLSSAKRLSEDQEPLRVARTALFGHEDNSNVPMPENSASASARKDINSTVPRNDDANGLFPGMPINRKDTRSYASEGLIAQWAVVSPKTDGRIKNVSSHS
ncbi:Metallo-dependent phosphatase-like protein [Coemansia spiralis]|nr:Metallo-dependent phosphatase-like protein [Coemansia spiralis]